MSAWAPRMRPLTQRRAAFLTPSRGQSPRLQLPTCVLSRCLPTAPDWDPRFFWASPSWRSCSVKRSRNASLPLAALRPFSPFSGIEETFEVCVRVERWCNPTDSAPPTVDRKGLNLNKSLACVLLDFALPLPDRNRRIISSGIFVVAEHPGRCHCWFSAPCQAETPPSE